MIWFEQEKKWRVAASYLSNDGQKSVRIDLDQLAKFIKNK